jgi:hypothetical protein
MGKFNFMDLIVKGNDAEVETPKPESKPQFPQSGGSIFTTDVPAVREFPTATASSKTVGTNKHLEEIVGVYERHFNSLNKEGYDFYEFYEAMSGLSPKTPDAYKMAIHFAKQMGGNVNKADLISMADYYINELKNLHDHQEQAGNMKLSEFNITKRVFLEYGGGVSKLFNNGLGVFVQATSWDNAMYVTPGLFYSF